MVPSEVLRDLSVIAEFINALRGSTAAISIAMVDDVRKRYGMTYSRAVTPADRDKIVKIASRFYAIFGASEKALASFANEEMSDLRFSPRIFDHKEGYGWHIHFFGDEFDIGDRIRSAGAMSIMSLIIHGESHRLKCCAADDCDKVFIDTTRNLSKIYCDPRTCGNRAHVAAFRARS